MSLWSVAFMGSTPIGGPAIGWVIAVSNARVGLGAGALAALVAAAIGFVAAERLGLSGRSKRPRSAEAPLTPLELAADD